MRSRFQKLSFGLLLIRAFGLLRIVLLVFALYSWIWLRQFENGIWHGPLWLIFVYDRALPILVGACLLALVGVLIFNLVFRLATRGERNKTTSTLSRILLWGLLFGILGGGPAFFFDYTWLQGITWDAKQYQLVQRARVSDASYNVYACQDPLSLSCESVLRTPELFLQPTPTPLPAPPTDDEGWRILPVLGEDESEDPTAGVVVTPSAAPAELILDTTGSALSLRLDVPNQPPVYAVITSTVGTGEP